MKQLLQAFKTNLLAAIVALLCIGAAAVLQFGKHADSYYLRTMFGTVLSAFGGALLAKAFDNVDERTMAMKGKEEEVKRRFAEQLRPINRHLANVSKEILSVVRSVDANRRTAHDGIQLIEQHVPNVNGALTDIGELIGEPFDPKTIYSTAEKMEELAKLLDGLSRNVKEGPDLAAIRQAQDALAEIHPDVYKLVDERISCPYCEALNNVMIGMKSPASAFLHCSKCGKPFHAHRSKNGFVFAKQPGTAKPPGEMTPGVVKEKASMLCACGSTVPYSFVKGVPSMRICFNCGRVCQINGDGVGSPTEEFRLLVDVASETNTKDDMMECPEHKSWNKVRSKHPDKIQGLCQVGKHLIVLTVAGK